jgi:hypothetical protein
MSFIGSGKIKIAPYASGATFGARNFRDVGNASTFEYSFSEEKKELKNYQDPAGGVAASFSRIDKVEGKIDFRKISAANLALALWGSTAPLNTTAITGEAHVAHAGAFVPTDRLINTAIAPVVHDGATVVDTDDYVVSAGGITFAETFTTVGLADGDTITIDYTPKASADVQGLINAAPDVSVFFEGTNLVDGKKALARMYKAKLGVGSNISMIGDDFATLSVTFVVAKDETVTGAGISQFLKLELES